MDELEQLKADIANRTPVGRFTCGFCGGMFPARFVAVRIESLAEGMLGGEPCPFCGDGGAATITYDTAHGGTGNPALSGAFQAGFPK